MFFTIPILVGIAAFIYYQITPSILEPTLWNDPLPLLKFEGPTAVNTVLSNAKKIGEGLHGPESMDFDFEDGTAYVSFGDGCVRSFTKDGELVEVVFFSGGYMSGYFPNGVGVDSEKLQSWCSMESSTGKLAWNTEGERLCGRPLGLRFRQENNTKYLYILDAYHGLFKLNLNTLHTEHLITPSTVILSHAHSATDPIALLPPLFYNDLDISYNGMIVFTDSSYKYTRSQNRLELLDGSPRGRVFEYNPEKKELYVLLCGLYFPNGIQYLSPIIEKSYDTILIPDNHGVESNKTHEEILKTHVIQNEIIINELTRFRVLKVNMMKTTKEGAHLTRSCSAHGSVYNALKHPYNHTGIEVFIDNMPGLIDNVRLDILDKTSSNSNTFINTVDTTTTNSDTSTTNTNTLKNSYYLYGLGSKAVAPISLLHLTLQSDLLKHIIYKCLPMKLLEKLVPRYGLILISNQKGEILHSLHDPSGKIALISQASRHPLTGDIWIGSHSESLAILPNKYLPDSWSVE